MRDVVEVDDRAQRLRLAELLVRRVVRREHDVLAHVARRLGKHELRERGTVAAEALLAQDLHQVGIRRRLHREILVESSIPGKGVLEPPRIRADGRLVIDVERRRIRPSNRLKLGVRKR